MSQIFSRIKNIAKSYLQTGREHPYSSRSDLDSEIQRIIDELNRTASSKTSSPTDDFFSNMPNDFSSYSQKSANPELENAFRILGISQNASNEEIKSAFKQQLRKFHPDRLRNASPAEQEKYNAITRDLIKAYNLLKKERNL